MSLADTDTGEIVDILSETEALTLARNITGQLDRINNESGALVELIADALKGKAWVGLGFGSWDQMVDGMGWEFTPRTSTDRAALAKVFRESGMSLRAIGKVIGAPKSTIADDLSQLSETGQLAEPERITGTDGSDRSAKNPHREGVGGDGEGNAGDADNGDGVDSHDVGQLEPESTPVDPAPSPGADGEVEAATDGDEVGAPVGHGPAATSPSPKPPRLVTVHDFLKPVTSHSWLTGVDPSVFWDVNDLASADTFLSWVDSMTAYAATIRDSQPNHLRLVEGPA